MFVAFDANGNVISVLGMSDNSIRQLKNTGPYFCPACKEQVILKAGKKRHPHFSHKHRCFVKPEGESVRHLEGKRWLYLWFSRQGFEPVLEKYIPEIQQRPDLYIIFKDRPVAVEFQASIIPVEELVKRTQAYVKHGIFPLWIVDADVVKKRHSNILHLTDFLSFFIHDAPFHQPSFITFNPVKKEFSLYTNLLPYSSQRALFDSKSFPFDTDWQTIVNTQIPPVRFYDYWLEVTEQWLMHLSMSSKARHNPFLHYLYKQHIHPLQLPPEVGIPVKHLYRLKPSPFIWQGYIWHYFLYARKEGAEFTLRDIYLFLSQTGRTAMEKRMTVTYWQQERERNPIYEYLRLLSAIGIVKLEGDTVKLQKPVELITKPNLMRHAMRKDFFRMYKGKIIRSLMLTNESNMDKVKIIK